MTSIDALMAIFHFNSFLISTYLIKNSIIKKSQEKTMNNLVKINLNEQSEIKFFFQKIKMSNIFERMWLNPQQIAAQHNIEWHFTYDYNSTNYNLSASHLMSFVFFFLIKTWLIQMFINFNIFIAYDHITENTPYPIPNCEVKLR